MLKKKKKQGWKKNRFKRRTKINKSKYELEQEKLEQESFLQQVADVKELSKNFNDPALMYDVDTNSIYIMEKEDFDLLNTEMENA